MAIYRSHGFTWPELLIVLVITGLLASLAIPAMDDAIARRRLDAAIQALLDTLGQARATAVRRGHPTHVCASIDGFTCSTSDWARGWIGRDARQGAIFDRVPSLDARLAVTHRQRRHAFDFDKSGTTPGTNQTITLCVRGRPATAISVIVGNAGLSRRESAAPEDAASCAGTSSRKR